MTPVFNGSASLRSAAGQLVENVCKSARRKEEMSDAYIEKQFKDVSSLYRLDQIKTAGEAGDEETEEETKTGWNDLPGVSKALLIVVPCIWILLAGLSILKSKKDKQKR